MKLLKCLGVLVFCMVVAGFIALSGGSTWGQESMGWSLVCGVVCAGFIVSIIVNEGKL